MGSKRAGFIDNLRIRRKFLFAGVLLVILPIALLGCFAFLHAAAILRQQAESRTSLLLESRVSALEERLDKLLSTTRALAQNPDVRDATRRAGTVDAESVRRRLALLAELLNGRTARDEASAPRQSQHEIVLFNSDRKLSYCGNPALAKWLQEPAQANVCAQLLNKVDISHCPSLADFLFSTTPGIPSLALAADRMGDEAQAGRPEDALGYVCLALDLREIEKILFRSDPGQTGRVFACTADGEIWTGSGRTGQGLAGEQSAEYRARLAGEVFLLPSRAVVPTLNATGQRVWRSSQKSGRGLRIAFVVEQAEAEVLAEARSLALYIAGGAAVFIAITLVLGWILTTSIVQPVQHAATGAQTIAGGDLRNLIAKEEGRRDEFGLMVDHLNEMILGLRSLISRVQQAVLRINASANQISATMEHQAQNARQLAGRSGEIAATITESLAAVTEIDHSMASVRAQAQEAQQSAKTALAAASHGLETIQQMVEGMQNLERLVVETGTRISQPGEQSQKIGRIVRMIADIANKTNLLALNAAIEAAKAGEHGEGFAVVANEIRSLADQTAEALVDIEEHISQIRSAVNSTVLSMEAGVTAAREGGTRAGVSRNHLENIVNQVRGSAEQAARIAKATDEQAAAIADIARASAAIENAVGETRGTAEDLSTATRQTSTAAGELRNLAAELRTLVSSFRLPGMEGDRSGS
jgi:methyl-accepting chemotaxis protein